MTKKQAIVLWCTAIEKEPVGVNSDGDPINRTLNPTFCTALAMAMPNVYEVRASKSYAATNKVVVDFLREWADALERDE